MEKPERVDIPIKKYYELKIYKHLYKQLAIIIGVSNDFEIAINNLIQNIDEMEVINKFLDIIDKLY